MKRQNLIFSSLVVVAAALWMSGCGTSSSGPSPQTPQAEHGDHDHSEHSHDGDDHSDTAEIAEQLAKLSPEDRAAAEKQKICPVTDEPLGSMGIPLKVSISGREVFVCCEGCVEPLKEEPEKYLAKLSK